MIICRCRGCTQASNTSILAYYSRIAFLIIRINNLSLITVADTKKRQILDKKQSKGNTRRFTYFYRTRTSGGFSHFLSNRVRGTFPRIYTDLFSRYHSPFLRLALSGEFLPAIASARGAQRSRDLRVIPRTFNSR